MTLTFAQGQSQSQSQWQSHCQSLSRVEHLPPYLLGSIQQDVVTARGQGREIIDLSHFNPEPHPPGAALDRLVQTVLQSHNHRYSASRGIGALRQAASAHYETRFGVSCDPETEVIATMGTKEGLSHLLMAILAPGDTVLVPVPAYPIHRSAVALAGASFLGVPLLDPDADPESCVVDANSEGFFSRLQTAVEQAWPRPRVLLLSFPHNPTTAVATPCFFKRIVEFATAHDLILVHDFAYADLTFDDWEANSLLQIPGAKERTIEFFSFSKGYGLAGWRLGFAMGAEPLVTALRKIKSYVDAGAFQPLQIAAIEVLKHSASVTREIREEYLLRRDTLVRGLRDLGWKVSLPKGTVFLWARIPEAFQELRSQRFAQLLLGTGEAAKPAGVAVAPGICFDPSADHFVRFALGETESRIRKAMQIIKERCRAHE